MALALLYVLSRSHGWIAASRERSRSGWSVSPTSTPATTRSWCTSGATVRSELGVRAGDWIAGRTLRELRLRDEGVVVRGVEAADGEYIGAPATVIEPGTTLVLYGRRRRIAELDGRPAGEQGDLAHAAAVAEESRDLSVRAA